MQTVILKLGGGVLTKKHSSRPVPRKTLMARIAKELVRARKRKPNLSLLLLCGAGSFGHPLVFKHRLMNRRLTDALLVKAGEVAANVRELGSLFVGACLKAGLPVFPFQTSSLTEIKNNKLVFKNFSVVKSVLGIRGIPVFGGDILVSGKGYSRVVSADDLAVLLAKYFKTSEIIFATDVDGVYQNFPPKKGEKPLKIIDRLTLLKFFKQNAPLPSIKKHDVTGEMSGKLKKLLSLRAKKAMIFNGQKPSLLARALLGKNVGTTVLL